MGVLLFGSTFAPVQGQTLTIAVTPGYINLGMSTTITITAPAAGTFTVVVDKPNGASTSLPLTFTSAGQAQNATYGSSIGGFGAVADQPGTYSVFLEQGGQVVASASFTATSKLNLSMDMVNGGLCDYIAGASRGTKMFPRFYITFASNGAPITNNTRGVYVTYTYPDGTKVNATWHAPTKAAPDQGGSGGDTGFFIGKFQPGWNYTAVGPWIPTVVAGDAYGNKVSYTYTGPAFDVIPASLASTVQVTDAATNLPIATLYSGENISIRATITYPASAEPTPGFVAPLDATARGGVVMAYIGWGSWNASADTFGGSAKSPGGLISTVKLTYSGANGTWTGQYTATSLPAVPAGQTYAVAVTSSDKASPANTGLQILALAAAQAPASVVTTTSGAIGSSSTSVSTSVSTLTSTVSQVVQTIPTIAYAGMAILLALGLIIGLVMRMRR